VFAWRDYLTLAQQLAGPAADEAAQRTAISRAYYAAYHAAAAFVRAKGILTVGHTHTTVWGALARDPDPGRADVGLKGYGLKQVRLGADYQNPFPGDLARQVRQSIAESSSVIETLDRLS
jgi:hypothetical protein